MIPNQRYARMSFYIHICTRRGHLASISKSTKGVPDRRCYILPSGWQRQVRRPTHQALQMFRPNRTTLRGCDMKFAFKSYSRPRRKSSEQRFAVASGFTLIVQMLAQHATVGQNISYGTAAHPGHKTFGMPEDRNPFPITPP